MGNTKGFVYLVGAGPGDPGLLTLNAMEAIRRASVIVYDRLVSEDLLASLPQGATRMFAGKSPGNHHVGQDEINVLLVRLARAGHQVVRLKGGDPLVFGRGAEEALALREAGIPFAVVPGVTAATACAAYAGVPLTHRGMADSVRFIAGHCREDRPLDLDWSSLARAELTLVVYMGLANVETLQTELIGAGRSAATPVAVVERGTTPSQRVVTTTLELLGDTVRQERCTSPCLIIIGEVVSLSDDLAWFSAHTESWLSESLRAGE